MTSSKNCGQSVIGQTLQPGFKILKKAGANEKNTIPTNSAGQPGGNKNNVTNIPDNYTLI